MTKLIAVIDDEPDILELVTIHLKKANYDVRGYSDGEHFLKSLKKEMPELIVLDLMLPDIDGIEICKYLKTQDHLSHIPIIMLTARSDVTDRVLGLEFGADDYITKPFSPRELVARVKAVLRRQDEKNKDKKIRIGKILLINTQKYTVAVQGVTIDLTPTEFKILKILAEKKGWVFSRTQLLDSLWGEDKIVIDRTIDVHIRHLRKKLGKAGKFIKNIRGIGYKIQE
jgi:DNA-binding response OmpR family regulator